MAYTMQTATTECATTAISKSVLSISLAILNY